MQNQMFSFKKRFKTLYYHYKLKNRSLQTFPLTLKYNAMQCAIQNAGNEKLIWKIIQSWHSTFKFLCNDAELNI